MTVEESIKMLQSMKYEDDVECSENIALDMAIKALEQQPCDNDCEHCEWVTCPKDEALEQQPCEDCVSREAVLKILNDNYRKWFITDKGFIECVGDIKDLPSVTPQNQWHKVEDELPKENGVYLACYEDATVLLDWFNGKWFFHGKNPAVEETGTIIAWMPLPEWKE